MPMRLATEKDLPEVVQIYNEVVANTTATFEENLRPLEEFQTVFAEKKKSERFPMIVIEENGRILGYGTYGPFRKASGYHTTVEHSLHISPEFRGRGLGLLLLKELIRLAQENGFHAMVGAIDSANPASLNLHKKCGFEVVGQMPRIAQKFSKWLDLTLMQLQLEPGKQG